MARPLRIGLIGFGNIGSGVIQALRDNRDLLDARCPRPLELFRVADIDLERPRPVEVDRSLLTTDAEAVLRDPEIDVVVELVGGLEPARSFVEQALRAGKHVVTANKMVLAHHGAELLALAQEKRVRLLFEAAVGGGIPVIRVLTECLAANRITRIAGILNGTCNYILTQMTAAGMSFDKALADAQMHGYAEPDPTADIESIDAANKIAILASLAFGLDIRHDDVHREGIAELTLEDLKAAEADGYVVKQLAVAEIEEEEQVAVGVRPTLLWKDHPLATVGDVLNGIIIEGQPIGAIFLVGPGAGPQATASAVLSDVIALSAFENGQSLAPPFLTMPVARKPQKRAECACDGYWLRILSDGNDQTLGDVARILATHHVSVERISKEPWELQITPDAWQWKPVSAYNPCAIRVHTGEISERHIREAIREIDNARWRVPESVTLALPRHESTRVPNWLSET